MSHKAATLSELQELHRLIATSLNKRIAQDMDDDLPTDAATLGAAIKFLKDNNVSADPADSEDLTALRATLTDAANKRKNNRSNVIALAQGDMKVMQG